VRIKLTLLRAEGRTTNVAVTADATATVGDVAAALFAGDPANKAVPVPPRLTLRASDYGNAGTGRTLDLASDLLSAGLRSGSTVALAQMSQESADPGRGRGPTAALLRVASGPDTGREFPLPVGASTIGRDPAMDVRLTDPLVSKRHARITIGDGIEIVDLNSANGLVIGGARVAKALLTALDEVVLGDSTITVTPLRPGGGGASSSPIIEVNRSPRVVPVLEDREIPAPTPPQAAKPRKFPLVAMVAPLLMGATLYVFTANPISLVFVALSPLIMVGTWLDSRISARRELKEGREAFEAGLRSITEEIEAAHRVERAIRLAQCPSTSEAIEAVHARGTVLWTHRPENPGFLTVRLGLGMDAPRYRLTLPAKGSSRPADWSRLLDLERRYSSIADVPLVGDFRSAGSIGVAGPRNEAIGTARALVAQLAAFHSPAELVIAAFASTATKAAWEWVEWLPHTGGPHSPLGGEHCAGDAGIGQALVTRLEELVAARRGRSDARPDPRGLEVSGPIPTPPVPRVPAVVVVVEDDAPVDRGRLTRLAELGPDVNVHVLWIASELGRLPAACRSFVQVAGDGAVSSAGFVRNGRHLFPVAAEKLDGTVAEQVARELSPIDDAGAPVEDAADLPLSVSMLSMVGRALVAEPRFQIERWHESGSIVRRDGSPPARRKTPATLRALVGQGATEALQLDLREQGPHALVGGTTGSGKSEFLQAWVLGMATAHSPDRLTFLLVDYKGGAAFSDCRRLPHTVGLVTDLSPHLVRRALTSLRAELRFREHLLNKKGAKDLVSLEQGGDPEAPPSLVIVVDEFAALAKEVPEFVDGVVDVAQRGRSLGLHLILATQRPAGVIKDNLRANTNLRVALRVADEAESNDVLGDPMAAAFSPLIPGRAAVRTGPGRIVLFQSAYAGARTSSRPPRPRLQVVEMAFGAGRAWETAEDSGSREQADVEPPTDIARLVESMVEAARLSGIQEPRKPWLPELAASYDLALLRQRTDAALALGVTDVPALQEQRTVYFEPDTDGNIAFYGGGGSGKSVALRTLVAASAVTPRGGPVHVYGLDFAGGGLAMLSDLPNVGSVISGDDGERVSRLFAWLRDLVDERAARYGSARASTISEYRAIASEREEPRILIVMDGFGAFRQEYETTPGRSALFTVFQQVLVDGRSVGVHFAIGADRPGSVPTSVASSIPRKIVLRQSDENGYLALGVARDVLSPLSPPGRAIDAVRGLEMQFAVLGGSSNVAEQARAIERLALSAPRAGGAVAPPIRRLPDHIAASELPISVGGLPALGIADDTLEPIGFEPVGTLVVSGPPASGRTTAVRGLAEAIRRWHPPTELVHFAPRPSPLSALPIWTSSAHSVDEAAQLAKDLLPKVSTPARPGESVVLIVEAIADYLGTPAEAPLTDAIKRAKRSGHFVVAEADSASWSSSWPLLTEVRSGRRGLSLQPDQMEGDMLFRTPFPRVTRTEFPPGRGLVVQAGRVKRVQLPLPD